MRYSLRCVACDAIVPAQISVTRCPTCGEALDVIYDEAEFRKSVAENFQKSAPISAKKYLAFYPLADSANIVSLDEGDTPLIALTRIGKKLELPNLFVKNEGQNPTGVFKDRGSLVEISAARELGAKAIVVASTGNMAASVSAYSAVAGLPCYVFIPEGTPLGKLAQSLSYGARVLQIRGTYGDCSRLAEETAAKYKFYLAGDYALRAEGQKSLAFEILEQLNYRVPDVVIVPVGCGTNLAGIWQGFVEFQKLGFTNKLPRLVAVQPEGCSTIVAAFQKNSTKAPIVTRPKTVCSAVGIGTPLDDVKALRALRDSHGLGVTVSDTATMKAQQELGSREAIFVEPSAALPLAVIPVLQKLAFLKPTDTVVLVATGAGLKDPRAALASHPTPASVEPTMSEIDRFFKYKLYAIRSAGYAEKEKTLFTSVPEEATLAEVIKKEFKADLKESHLAEICTAIESFLEKGKTSITKVDLQHLVEDALTDLVYEERMLEVVDYQLKLGKQSAPSAHVVVKFGGEQFSAEARGVGPVDAIITALRSALKEKDALAVRLTDFSVHVDDRGTDAATKVSMKLRDAEENSVIASATSPDIIAASIAAFEKGYNILYWKGKKQEKS